MTGTDVEKIMQEIRLEAAGKEAWDCETDFFSCIQRTRGILDTKDVYCEDEYERLLRVQSWIWDNHIEFSRELPKSVIGLARRCVKRVIAIVMNPWIASQNEFNANVVNANIQLCHYVHQKEKDCRELERRIEQLEKMVTEMKER